MQKSWMDAKLFTGFIPFTLLLQIRSVDLFFVSKAWPHGRFGDGLYSFCCLNFLRFLVVFSCGDSIGGTKSDATIIIVGRVKGQAVFR